MTERPGDAEAESKLKAAVSGGRGKRQENIESLPFGMLECCDSQPMFSSW